MDKWKRFLSIVIAAALMISAVACDRGGRSREDEEDPEETEDRQLVEERDALPITSDILDGVWVTEDGYFCEFDMDEMFFLDLWGLKYDIISVSDDHLMIVMQPVDYTYFSPATALPVNDVIELDVECYGDSIDLLGRTCYRSDSDTGSGYDESVRSGIAGQTFTIGTYLGNIEWTFNDDMSGISISGLDTETSVEITDYEGGIMAYEDETGASGELIIRYINGELVWCANGDVLQLTSYQITDPSDWVHYDSETGEVTVLSFDPKVASGDDSVPVMLGLYGSQDLSYMGQSYSAISLCDGLYRLNAGSEYMVNAANPYAYELIRRAEYIEQPEGSLNLYEYDFDQGSLTFEKFDNEWPSDVIHFYRIADYNWHSAFPDYDTTMAISDGYCAEFNEDREAELSFTFDSPSSDDVCIYRINDNDELIPVDTVISGGTATASISESGVYILSYNIDNYGDISEENYFAMDPHDSAWARSGEAGDIPDLVDMEYIEQSYNSVFVIDSAEDLASLTYFINTYPRDYDDGFFVWVDLVEDIDLSDYEWAPMGTTEFQFSGLFCGNGHTIRGLTIRNDSESNAFFGSMYASNIVGLNIEEAFITGQSAHLMFSYSSTTDFIDCHAEGELPENPDTGIDLFPDYSDYGNNGYHYCSYSIINGYGELFEDEFSSNYPRPNEMNDVENHFDPDGDGVFDYSEDYYFG